MWIQIVIEISKIIYVWAALELVYGDREQWDDFVQMCGNQPSTCE